MKVKDLDIIVPEDKAVVISGKQYVIPGDMPVETSLRLQKSVDGQDEANPEAVENMIDAVLDLLAIKQDIDRDRLRKNMSMKQITAIMEFVHEVEKQ